MNNKTAIDFLINELGEYFPHYVGGIEMVVGQAKKLEREQIEDAYNASLLSNTQTFEHYWEQTYGGQHDPN